MVENIRISDGTGAVLGLWKRKMSARPTTGYLMTFREGKCTANCGFCPQAASSKGDAEKLSRIGWPGKPLEKLLDKLEGDDGEFERVCVQALNYPGVSDDLFEIVDRVREVSEIPISISCQPLETDEIGRLSEAGIDRMGIPLDAATPEVFDSVKGKSAGGPYRWNTHMESIERAREILGKNVTTHLVAGLGETEKEMVERIQALKDEDIEVALFAFTPIEGTAMEDIEKPSIESYRRIQLARHLIFEGSSTFLEMEFENGRLTDFGAERKTLVDEISSGKPFITSGCPGYNRPYYNESPGGPMYNYPQEPTDEETEEAIRLLGI